MKSHRINQFFGRYAAFLLRWRWVVIALFAVLLFVAFKGMSKMVQQTSFDDYFIEGDPMLVVVLVLTVPIALWAMRLAERTLKKPAAVLK